MKDNFEKIFLSHGFEEYYPVQVRCGANFSLILAIEAKSLQWLEEFRNSTEKSKDKKDYFASHEEEVKEALSRSRVFFSGRLISGEDEIF